MYKTKYIDNITHNHKTCLKKKVKFKRNLLLTQRLVKFLDPKLINEISKSIINSDWPKLIKI